MRLRSTRGQGHSAHVHGLRQLGCNRLRTKTLCTHRAIGSGLKHKGGSVSCSRTPASYHQEQRPKAAIKITGTRPVRAAADTGTSPPLASSQLQVYGHLVKLPCVLRTPQPVAAQALTAEELSAASRRAARCAAMRWLSTSSWSRSWAAVGRFAASSLMHSAASACAARSKSRQSMKRCPGPRAGVQQWGRASAAGSRIGAAAHNTQTLCDLLSWTGGCCTWTSGGSSAPSSCSCAGGLKRRARRMLASLRAPFCWLPRAARRTPRANTSLPMLVWPCARAESAEWQECASTSSSQTAKLQSAACCRLERERDYNVPASPLIVVWSCRRLGTRMQRAWCLQYAQHRSGTMQTRGPHRAP